MEYREASKKARDAGAKLISGSVNKGQIVKWETPTRVFTFVPRHAYTTEGDLTIKRK